MADITLAQLTEGTVTGSGVFDVLMKSTKAHLEQEFAANRIRGTDYANVYLGSMNSAMQVSVQFLLGEQAADKQAELLTSQVVSSTKQSLKLDEEIALLAQKVITEKSQTETQIGDVVVNGLLTESLGVVGKQKLLYQQQTEGFKRDAEQKLTKYMIDTWSVRQSTSGDASLTGTGLIDTEINRVLNQAKIGIGMSGHVPADFASDIAALVVTFTDTSLPAEGSIVSWLWDFDDGQTSTVKDPVNTYTAIGSYQVRLTVTDSLGFTGTVVKNIVVV